MAVIQDININVHGQPSEKRLQTFLRLSQNENGRSISFRVLGAPLPSGCTATFAGTKPDGNVYSTTGTVTGNFVVVQEDMQMTAVAGVWDAKLDIINGTHNIMTALIRVVVDADVVDPDAIASDSQLQGLVAETKYYAEHARTDAYGSPLTATLKAEMTDKTRVYVYTGSESGMTAGNWYTWNGSAWVSGGVYNAVAVQTDTTLSVAGKAADGKTTGDAIEELKEDLIIRQKAITDGFDVTGSINTGLYIYAGEVVCVDVTAVTGTVNMYIAGYTQSDIFSITLVGKKERSFTHDGYLAFYALSTATISAHVTLKNTISDVVSEIVPQLSAISNSLNRTVDASLELGALNTTYGANTTSTTALRTPSYISKATQKLTFQNAKVRLFAYSQTGTFIGGYSATDGWTKDWAKYTRLESPVYLNDYNDGEYLFRLVFDNITGEVTPENVNVKLDISKLEELDANNVEVYSVGANGDFSTFTEMLVALADNANKKIVSIYGGTYDVFAEMGGAEYMQTVDTSLNWRAVNHILPPNTELIGVGDVVLTWNPTDEQIIDQSHAFLFSPLNLSGNCVIKNIKIHCSNCRYGIHDETSGLAAYNGVSHIFENVEVIYTESTYGVKYAYGAGHNRNSKYSFKNCLFSAAYGAVWSTHDWPASALENSVFEFDNCRFINNRTNTPANIRFSSSDTVGRLDDVKINACVFNSISFSTEGSVDIKQGYKVSTMLCKPYTPTWASHILEADRVAPVDYLVLG